MTVQHDLFSATPSAGYPERPGAKGGATSRSAADAMAATAPTLRATVLAYLRRHGDLTADEIAARAGLSVLAIRPRVSELVKAGAVVATDKRRPNTSGHLAIVWRAAAGAP